MKTLIAYGTKSGTAKSLSEMLSKKIKGDVTVINLKEQKNIDISNFDTIIIGGSIRTGQRRCEVKSFCKSNINKLKQKNVGLFISCGNEKRANDYMKKSFTKELFEKALAKEYFGFEMNPDKLSSFDKLMVNVRAFVLHKRKLGYVKKIREDNIEKVSSIINNLQS